MSWTVARTIEDDSEGVVKMATVKTSIRITKRAVNPMYELIRHHENN